MRLLVDGVFFQLASSGIARLWQSVLSYIASTGSVEVFVLDRGKTPPMKSVVAVPFPSYRDRYTADDSFLIQKICDHYAIDVFSSSYYTTPISTPMLLVVYDMIPEVFGFEMTDRFWAEKEIAISFARRFVAISQRTKKDLIHFYPEIPENHVVVAYPGVDRTVFHEKPHDEIEEFKQRLELERPYLLLVGSREQNKGYKNGKLLFEALSDLEPMPFDVLCIGGEPLANDSSIARMPEGSRVLRIDANDNDLALAYAGAVALVYPSLYEGFGLPIIEAMASGCPVITTVHGSLGEIVDEESAVLIDGTSVAELQEALKAVQQAPVRKRLSEAGLKRASDFGWDTLATAITREAFMLADKAASGTFETFFQRWEVLRDLQASVDSDTIPMMP